MRRQVRAVAMTVGLGVVLGACGEGGGVRVVEGARSPWVVQGTALGIMGPFTGMSVENPVRVEFVTQNFEAGRPTHGADARGLRMSDVGQHLHLIVDDGPFLPVYDLSRPFELPAPLSPGTHVLRAFPVRQWHESVKTGGAFEVVQFAVGNAAPEPPIAPGSPLLTYSMPVGTYVGPEADSILVDFFVRNAEVGVGGHSVRLTIDDVHTARLDRWAPYYILGLVPGSHTVRMELLDPQGAVVPGPYNTAEHTITVLPAEGAGGPVSDSAG